MKNQLAAFESSKLQNPQSIFGGGGKDTCCCEPDKKKAKGNNGFGNGGDEPAPGNSGTNGSPNADQKLADVVR